MIGMLAIRSKRPKPAIDRPNLHSAANDPTWAVQSIASEYPVVDNNLLATPHCLAARKVHIHAFDHNLQPRLVHA